MQYDRQPPSDTEHMLQEAQQVRLAKSHNDANPQQNGPLVDEDWPDDLCSLAEQLGDDARHLAATFPAGESRQWSDAVAASAPLTPADSNGSRSFAWRFAAASLLLALGIGVMLWSAAGHGPAGQQTDSVAQENSRSRRAPAEQPPAEQPAADKKHVAREDTSSPLLPPSPAGPNAQRLSPVPPLMPAGVFEDLSAPEQEALLDLMEVEGIKASSLSI